MQYKKTSFLILSALVLILCTPVSLAETNDNITLNVTAIFSGSTAQQLSMEAMKDNPNINYTAYLTTKIPSNLDLSKQDMILLDLYIEGHIPTIEQAVNNAKDGNNATVVILSPLTEAGLALGNVNHTEHPYITQYFDNSGLENHKRLFTYLLVNFFGADGTVLEPIVIPKQGIYHPDSSIPFANVSEYLTWYEENDGNRHVYDPEKPTVVILFHTDSYVKNTPEITDSLIREFEANDINCVAEYGNLGDALTLVMNTTTITPYLPFDAIINTHSYRIRSYSTTDSIEQGVDYLEALNVPLITAVTGMYQTTPEQWKESNEGIPTSLLGTRVALPELDGAIEFIVVSGEVKDSVTEVYHKAPIDEQVEWLVNRTLAWTKLRHCSNADKKVALIYYHHASGKDEVGVMDEGGLDTHASLVNVLKELKEEGYDTGHYLPDVDSLVDLMQSQGKNIGVWAPGELENMVKNGNVTLIPESVYLEWFNELSEDKRNEVTERWGEAPGEIMVYENETGKYIVIPNIQFGNILLAPQPMRGKGQNESVMFYDEAVVPHHQYIAFYLWLNKQYEADALVHFGTYGSFEYLPGKQTGLDVTSCWPAILIQDMPHLYLYTMDGTAGATQAKRRSNAVIIDYMTPPLVAAGLYGNLTILENELLMYDLSGEELVKQQYRESIVRQCEELNLDYDLNVNLTTMAANITEFDLFKEDLSNYLYTLKNQYMPYGLHTLGEPPEGNSLVSMVISMLGSDFKQYVKDNSISDNGTRLLISEVIINGTSPEDAQNMVLGTLSDNMTEFLNTSLLYSANMDDSRVEVARLIAGLNGEFIPPGSGGDPVRTPDALPTGRNLYSFRSDEIPTKAAWNVGVEMADQLLEQYLADNSTYPQKVAVFLWATETMKHQGVMESEIMYLMGVKPAWNAYGRPATVQLIPAAELGRPRIDVVIVPSGVYRDTFPDKLTLLDKAIKLASAAQDTELYPNYVNQSSTVTYEWLIENGYNESVASQYSTIRIFSASEGSYGPSISVPIGASGSWEDDSVIGNYFIDGWGYAYGEKLWGEQLQDLFRQNLDGVEVITHSVSSNNYGVLYGDGYFSDLGGLSLAIRTVSGETPDIYLSNLRDPSNPVVETLSQFLVKELRTRNLNPEWIKGMMEYEYYGSSIMSSGLENLWGWEVTTPDLITDDMWDEMYEVYIQDKYDLGMEEFFNENNPWARQSMLARMLEASRKDYWDASNEVIQALTAEYAESVAENGVTCCHHTCGNPTLDEYVNGIMSVPGVVSEETAAEYNNQMYEATYRTRQTTTEVTEDTEKKSSSGGGTGEAKIVESGSSNQTIESIAGYGMDLTEEPGLKSTQQDNYVEGYEMTSETIEPETSSATFSAVDVMGIVIVFALLGIIGYGWRKKS
ncbi:cobaltochelatase subunit CobN [Methanolobus psychrotolerans]|uniref:cobaltochelatase subunit CobN n=1 Tax=Methanolobus psychrotolerans TaxID=1874706 RepID=UPI000B91C2FC|nr:cobaltochelatase subunit CobN [Methanolobus psychrotolerans]